MGALSAFQDVNGMTSHYDITTRWADVALGRTTKSNFSANRTNVFGVGDRIFSYGQHFEMARILRDAKDRPRAFLLNGDTYSVTTTRHQGEVRGALAHFDLPRVIIPHSALTAAGIDFDSVEIVHVTQDRHEEINHVSYEQPLGSVWREVQDSDYVDLTAEELDALVAKRNAEKRQGWEWEKRQADAGNEFYRKNLRPEPPTITVDDIGAWDRREYRTVGNHMELHASSRSSYRTIKVEQLEDGRTKYSWTTHKHWLGESLIRGKVAGQQRRLKCKAHTPPNEVTRRAYCDNCEGHGWRYVTGRSRWAYFLSGFDHNEPRPVYFFCELPRGIRPTTVDEAYEDLKPDPVKLAEQMGRRVHRQGDIFAIEMRGLTKRDLRARGARFEKRGNLLRTNHEATEVAYLPDGSTLVRGTLWHAPDFRAPDHRRVTVGKSWHLAIKNTVPVAK